MSRMVSSEFTCLCMHKNPIQFRKPKPLQPSVLQLTCMSCGSEFYVRFSHDSKLKEKSQLKVEFKIIQVSDKLKEILKAKEVEALEKLENKEVTNGETNETPSTT